MTRAELEIPFPSRVHPQIARVLKEHAEWMKRMGLTRGGNIPSGYDERGVDIVPFMFPDMPYEGVLYATHMMGIMVFTDDYCAYGEKELQRVNGFVEQFLGRMQEPVGHRHESEDPLLRAWDDNWSRVAENMSKAWRTRALKHWRLFIAAFAKENSMRQQGVLPKLETYFGLRREAVGALPFSDLIESGYGFELSLEVMEHPVMQCMIDAFCDVMIMINDAHSLQIEIETGEVNNMAKILMHEHGYSKDDAIAELQRVCRERCNAFIHLDGEIRKELGVLDLSGQTWKNIDTYIGNLRSMMRGHYDWSLGASRYDPKTFAMPQDFLEISRETASIAAK
ncbi:MAG TPA: hypothetical protein VMA74_19200 [Dyella sp.]|uniref:terpene synthase family protein n=1 Tax=Dyella sp. TaxID=1869338 RepID=UPI002B7B5440|nr:hypothetical protein [Dyella sp.]HUB91856.1 hypothetical protein [Dyella sp.]